MVRWIAAPALLAALVASSGGVAETMPVDATGCLKIVSTSPSAACTTKASLKVDLVNTCKIPIRAQLCLRGASHVWVKCESKDSLAPQEHFSGVSCDSNGDYTYWGCSKFSATSGNCGGNGLVGRDTNAPK